MNIHPLNKLTIAVLLSITAIGCGGGGSSESSDNNQPQPGGVTKITVFDGLLNNASVCLDTNANGQCGQDEYSVRTNDQGVALIPAENYSADAPIIATAIAGETTDITRGPVTTSFQLKAPAGYEVVNPFTTLASQQIDKGSAEDDAVQIVAEALQQVDSSESVDYYAELIQTDFTQSSIINQLRALRVAELLTDQYITANYDLDTLMTFVTSVSANIADISSDDLPGYFPEISYDGGVFTYLFNQAPQATGSIANQTVDFLGDPIEDVDLNALFTDTDDDLLSYTLSPSVAGLKIRNGILSGSPEAAGTYNLSVTASDGSARSLPINFQLMVEGEVRPPEPVKTLTGFKNLGAVPQHNAVMHYDNNLYFVRFYSGGADLVQMDKEGNRTTYTATAPWSILTQYGKPVVYNGYNTKVRARIGYSEPARYDIGRVIVNAPYQIGEKYYFSAPYTNEDGSIRRDSKNNILYGYWEFSFSADGTPALTERPYDTDTNDDGELDAVTTLCPEQNHFSNNCFNGYFSSHSHQSTSTEDEFENQQHPSFGDALHHNGKYYQVNRHSSTSNVITIFEETVSFDEAESRYVSSFKKTEVELTFNDSTGMPVKELQGLKMMYHESLDGLIVIANYNNPGNTSHRDESYIYAFIDGKTNQARLVQLTHEETYSGQYTDTDVVFIPTPYGALVVHTHKVAIEFNVNQFTATEIAIDYPIAYSWPKGEAWLNSDGTFFNIEEDYEYVILSEFE